MTLPRPYLRQIGSIPVLGRALVLLFRLKSGISVAKQPALNFLRWLFRSREYTNYTYDLTPLNKSYLACMVAEVTGIKFELAWQYMNELENDGALKEHIRNCIATSEDGCFADADVKFGRRVGWYAFVRAIKPDVIVETGVDKGLGACVLTAALKRNATEGHRGYYYGTDINPRAGYQLKGEYAKLGRVLYGDSIQSLKSLDEKIDLFINDSDHSTEYEASEYEVIKGKLSDRAVILGDNSHLTKELFSFAMRNGMSFLFFQERPHDHWYPGDGIGVAFRRRSLEL